MGMFMHIARGIIDASAKLLVGAVDAAIQF